MSQPVYERRYTCRACTKDALESVLDLGLQPLANAFLKAEQLDQPELRVPLHLVRCSTCGLGQLTHVVHPSILYGQHYPYRSGYAEGWAVHCHDLAEEIGEGKRVLEIGCLDGVMLRHCMDNGCTVLGVDPSAPRMEVPVRRELFTSCSRYGEYDVVVAQNVFGHVDDARGFLEGVIHHLAPGGVCIIECPWIVDLIERREWDTVYHEHLSYWGVRSMSRVAHRAGLAIREVRHFPGIHGGTLRYTLGPRDLVPEVTANFCQAWLAEEVDHTGFAEAAQRSIAWWSRYFFEAEGKRIYGYGASAKGNTLLNALPERPRLNGIFDDNPAKHGLYTPG